MRQRQLMIGVPTKDHPKYIQAYLSRTLDDAKTYGIDLHIYDSSEDNLTEHIVSKRIKNGYDNLYYHRCASDDIVSPPTEKLKNILVDSGYEYVWLCGDGVMLNLDNAMPYVNQEMDKNRDLIIFGVFDETHNYTEYNNPIKLILEQWKSISFYGGTIYRGNFFSEVEWKNLFDKYPDNIHLVGVFDIFARKPMNVVSVDTAFFIKNPYKEEATWISGGRLLQAVVEKMPMEINRLPHMYDFVKNRVGRSFAEVRGMFLPPNIWWLRANDNISPKKTVKYRKQLKEITNTKYFLFVGASLIPKKLARKIARIISYS